MKRVLIILVFVTLSPPTFRSVLWAQCYFQPSIAESLAYRSAIADESALRFVDIPARTSFPIRVLPHIVRESDQSGGISTGGLQAELDKLVNAFSFMQFSFEFLPADYIDNSDYYHLLDNERQQLFAQSWMCNAVNIYFVGQFERVAGERREGVSTTPTDCGINNCDAPEDCREGIVIDFLFPNGNSAIQHEFGHYFGLWHTFSNCRDHENPEVCYENVNQTVYPNCREVADLLCDTPADPGLDYQLSTNCEFQGTGSNCAQQSPCRDSHGDHYDPDTHNYMSYAISDDGAHECRTSFSPEQTSVATASLIDRRWELRQDVYTGQPSEYTAQFIDCLMRQDIYRSIPIAPVQTVGSGEMQEFVYLRQAYVPPEVGAVMINNGDAVAFFVKGAIYAKYIHEQGGATGALGYPVSDEGDAYSSRPHNGVQTTGRYTRFEHGTINYISGPPDHLYRGQSFAVTGPFWTTFSAGGQYSGYFGYPTSDSYQWNGTQKQDFEDGYMFVNSSGAAEYVAATQPRNLTVTSVLQDLLRLGWEDHSNDETAFVVHYNSTSPLLDWDTLVVLPPNTVSFDHTGLQPGVIYNYYVTASIDSISSPPTNMAYGRAMSDSLDLFLTGAEYFFDTDQGLGQGTMLTVYPEDGATLVDAISVTHLPPGFHTLFLRYRDSRGVWSAAEGRSFYVTPPLPQGVQTITQAEMFYDTDPGTGNGDDLPVIIDDEVVLTTTADLNSLAPGLHRVYLRFRTNGGAWSAVEGRSLYVTPSVPTGLQTISAAEYFYDDDPGQGQASAIELEVASDIILTRAISPVAVAPGFHRLYLRYLSNSNAWSASEGRGLYVTPAISESLFIAGGEIFLDSVGSPGEGLALIADDGTFEESHEDMHRNMPVSALSIGQHYVFARVQDSRGFWSNVVSDSFAAAVPENIELVAKSDSLGQSVRLVWTTFAGATEYHVHHDSSATGTFTDFMTVVAPDTSLLLATIPGQGLRFYQVVAILPSRATGREDGVALPDSYSLSTKQPILPGPVALPHLEKDSLRKH